MPETTQSPSTIVNDSSAGSTAWTNPGNAASDDGSYATAGMAGATTTQYLKATNFGFSLPGGSTVNGIGVAINRKGTLTRNSDSELRLVVGGSVSGDDKASATTWTTSDATATYGGSSDLWGLSLSDTDINSSDFGVALRAQSSNTANASVDHITITVYYTLYAGGDVIKQVRYYQMMRS